MLHHICLQGFQATWIKLHGLRGLTVCCPLIITSAAQRAPPKTVAQDWSFSLHVSASETVLPHVILTVAAKGLSWPAASLRARRCAFLLRSSQLPLQQVGTE